MSRHINVNPDHYKVAGRERPGSATANAPKQAAAVNRELKEASERWQKRERKQTGGAPGRPRRGRQR
jgi:hypothetical protein